RRAAKSRGAAKRAIFGEAGSQVNKSRRAAARIVARNTVSLENSRSGANGGYDYCQLDGGLIPMTDAVTETAEARPRLLLADDSKVIRSSAARILGEEFDVLLAVDGQDAWDQLTQHDDI